MDQISELKRSERKQKEVLQAVVQLVEDVIAELNLDTAKLNRLKERARNIHFLLR
jgi:hypothetical protein